MVIDEIVNGEPRKFFRKLKKLCWEHGMIMSAPEGSVINFVFIGCGKSARQIFNVPRFDGRQKHVLKYRDPIRCHFTETGFQASEDEREAAAVDGDSK